MYQYYTKITILYIYNLSDLKMLRLLLCLFLKMNDHWCYKYIDSNSVINIAFKYTNLEIQILSIKPFGQKHSKTYDMHLLYNILVTK